LRISFRIIIEVDLSIIIIISKKTHLNMDQAAAPEKEISLNTGAKMPAIGYGCWKVD